MASGDTLIAFPAAAGMPPASGYATFDLWSDLLVLDFDKSIDEAIIFEGVLPSHYAGGGLKVLINWTETPGETGSVVWAAQFDRMQIAFWNPSSPSWAAAKTVEHPYVPGQKIKQTAISFSDGAEIDSLVAGEPFLLKVYRDADHANDTIDGDVSLFSVIIEET